MQISSLNSVGIHICVLTWGGKPWPPKPDPMGPNAATSHPPPLQRARKWHKINIFLDIAWKHCNFYLSMFGLYYLLGHKQARSAYISEIWYSLKFCPSQSHLSGSAIDNFLTCRRFFIYKNRCSSITKVKTGRHVIRHVECLKKSLFVTVLRLWKQGFTI